MGLKLDNQTIHRPKQRPETETIGPASILDIRAAILLIFLGRAADPTTWSRCRRILAAYDPSFSAKSLHSTTLVGIVATS
jgi:hypothetical protein